MVHISLSLRKKLLGKKNRRGQTEMLGLVVIMVLIVIGALFYVKFAVFGNVDGGQQRANTIKSIQAYNLMNAIMNIDICEDVSVRAGIAKCMKKNELCGNSDSCGYLDEKIDNIVKMAIYKDYSLNVTSSAGKYSLGSCKYGVSSYGYIYNFEGDTYKAFFKICEKKLES